MRTTVFLFALLAGALAVNAAVVWMRSSTQLSQAEKAMTEWQPSPGKLVKLESFFRTSSFYYEADISYQWGNAERIFSESWIPRDWWDKAVGVTSTGSVIMLHVDAASPDHAMWNPRFQADRYRERRAKNQTYFWVGLVACAAFSLAARLIPKEPS